MTKTILCIGDPHCGSKYGLTPPEYDSTPGKALIEETRLYNARRELWDFYIKNVKKIKPDVLIVNGDLIDGIGKKSGGREQLTTDITEQQRIAAAVINKSKAKQVYIIRGTGYHVTGETEHEDEIANLVDAEYISNQMHLDVYGTIINVKHHIGSSGIPHGRATAVLRSKLWNSLKSIREEQPKADIIIRSHTHYFMATQDAQGVAMILPALQLPGTVFGSKICEGIVDIGMVILEVSTKKYNWRPIIANLECVKEHTIMI